MSKTATIADPMKDAPAAPPETVDPHGPAYRTRQSTLAHELGPDRLTGSSSMPEPPPAEPPAEPTETAAEPTAAPPAPLERSAEILAAIARETEARAVCLLRRDPAGMLQAEVRAQALRVSLVHALRSEAAALQAKWPEFQEQARPLLEDATHELTLAQRAAKEPMERLSRAQANFDRVSVQVAYVERVIHSAAALLIGGECQRVLRSLLERGGTDGKDLADLVVQVEALRTTQAQVAGELALVVEGVSHVGNQ